MQQLTLRIAGLSCQHCVMSVTGALRSVAGVREVCVSLASGTAVVVGENLDAEQLIRAVAARGYSAEISGNHDLLQEEKTNAT